jgi:hypothetical protein
MLQEARMIISMLNGLFNLSFMFAIDSRIERFLRHSGHMESQHLAAKGHF